MTQKEYSKWLCSLPEAVKEYVLGLIIADVLRQTQPTNSNYIDASYIKDVLRLPNAFDQETRKVKEQTP